jgi:glucose-1-phosphate cytidylyltransferase
MEAEHVKVVILAGGFGTRITEESAVRPKPMVEIGSRPILWHIMKIYSAHGLNDFVICCGYKGHLIKEWFAAYGLHSSDVTFDLRARTTEYHSCNVEPWRVTLVDTGESTMTGGRLKRVARHLGDEPFCMTYGDGVSDVDITKLIAFHRASGRLATLTAVQPEGRFGAFSLKQDSDLIEHFREKPKGDGAWINGGFFVLDPAVLASIEGDSTVFEQEPLVALAAQGQLAAYRHDGFWFPMDTLRDRNVLEGLWSTGNAPWKVW